MDNQPFYYRWEWHLAASPEALWPLVADTNRFNMDTGLPTVQHGSGDGREPNARRRLFFYRLGIRVEWDEEPFEWVRPYRFGVVRRYASGPVAEMRVLADLTETTDGGTHLVYQVWAWPKGALGRLAIPIQIGFLSGRSFDKAFRSYGDLASSGRLPVGEAVRANFVAGGHARLRRIRDELLTAGANPQLLARFVRHLETSDDLTLARIRPYVLADYWDVPRHDVLEICLWATRLGMLDLRWDVLCPLCRGDKSTSDSLSGMKPDVHCTTCNIDFHVNFEHLVELTFRPNPAIRDVTGDDFCVAGPRVTPHIEVQQLMPPGALREASPFLDEGRYRLRALELPGGQFVRVAPEGAAASRIEISSGGWPEDELVLSPTPTLHLQNQSGREHLVVLERLEWSDQAVTAAEVIAMQLFRDLFADEVLRPGEQVSVGSLTIMFTDIQDSTRVYAEIGDAPAFGLVMDHFDVLRDAIIAENGAIVKTLGDAIMAVFREPAAGLRAALAAQERMLTSPIGPPNLVLKVGLHHGPAIAVTLNERLDYFGSTVNIAARLEGVSRGGDIVVTDAVWSDPEVAAMLDDLRLRAERFIGTVRGFEAGRLELWRIVPTF